MRGLVVPSLLVLALTAAACQGKGKAPTTGVRVASPQAHVASVTSPRPSQAPSPTALPSPVATPAAHLVEPKSGASVLAGHVTLDASYIVANNGGNLVSNNAGSILAAGAVSGGEGRLIANNGGGLVADGDGNVIAGAETPLLSDHGSGILSDHGSGLISDVGGGLVSKTKRQLLAAEAPEFGSLLPAAGVEIHVRSLKTGQRVSVGEDPDGKPVYGVYSNLQGAYKLYVPSDEANLLVEATIPQTTDPRQQYSVLAPKGVGAEVDEDTGVASRELLAIAAGRIANWMTGDPASWLCILGNTASFSDTTRQLLIGGLTDLHDRAKAAGVTADPAIAPAVRLLAWRCANVALSVMDLKGIKLGDSDHSWGDDPNEPRQPALEAMTQVFKDAREGATPKLAADPAFFDKQAYFQQANACAPGRYVIKRPADVSAFLQAEYMVDGKDPGLYAANQVFISLGIEADSTGIGHKHRLNTALNEFVVAIGTVILANANGELDEMHRLIASFDPKAVPGPDVPAAAPSSCPRPVASSGLAPCLSAPSDVAGAGRP